MNRLTPLLLAATVWAAQAEGLDHVGMIKSLRHGDAKAGRALYALHCTSCHGKDGDLALNPLARRFAKDELKFGSDPYSLWKTTSYGNGLMFRWDAVLTDKERYQIVHHIREEIIKENNPGQYFKVDEGYFEGLNEKAKRDAGEQAKNAQKVIAAPGMIDGSAGRRMDYGPFLQHAVAYSEIKNKNAEHIENTTESAMAVRVSDEVAVCYDTARLSISGIWKIGDGKLADTTKTHHTSYKGSLPLRPSGEVIYKNIDAPGWRGGQIDYHGHYVHGDRVVLSYRVGDREILDTVEPDPGGSFPVRRLQIGAGDAELTCLPGTVIAPSVKITHLRLSARDGNARSAKRDSGENDLRQFTSGGARRWATTVQTAVARGEDKGGYALDVLTAPLANPFGAWMRISALDFFSDGRIAASTLSGDVWIVSWEEGIPDALTWSRFAAGLYEPLGLRIVDDKVYVRGRDRITRLHDLNGDGEADFYENFYADENEIGASYHAFIYDLQTDRQGNFYFSQSGYKSPLTGGVVRIDREGRYPEFIGTDLRNPNGIGVGGPHDWVTVSDNPSGKAVYNGFTIGRKGAIYGYEKNRNLPMLTVVPARVDSSTTGQCWSDEERWGPLGGSLVFGSWSRCALFYTLVQDLGDTKFPNGFSVRFPWDLKSAPLRPRASPADGQLYVAAQRGWDSIAQLDGAIYRIRHTGKPDYLLSGAAATREGIRLTFPCELDPTSVKATAFSAVRVSDQKQDAGKPQPLGGAKLIDPHTVEIEIPDIGMEVVERRTDKKTGSVRVNPAISLRFSLLAEDGTPLEQTVHATINSLP